VRRLRCRSACPCGGQARDSVLVSSQPGRTLNAAIYRARGEFVAILNSDDAYHPERLADCLEVFRDDPGIALVTTALDFVDEQGDPIHNRSHERGKAFYQEMGRPVPGTRER